MRCIHCNSEVEDGTNFCPYCGNQIVISQQTSQPQQSKQPQQGQYQQPQQGQYQQPQQGQYQQPQQGQYQQPQQGQYQQPQQGQYQQPQQGQYQQPQQGQYQQPQQGQYQQPYQGQYQQPYQGQYQQPYQGQYQQSQQGQYQQSYQGQYQQPQQGQYQQSYQGYQQPFAQPKPQLPHRPQLTFMEAINIASHRLQEVDGRSRRSEYWWWFLAVSLGTAVLSFIPYVGNLLYIVEFFLLYAITIRRLHDCSAPDWLCKMYPGVFALYSICMVLFGFYTDDPHGFARDIIRFFGDGGFIGILAGAGILSLIVFVYSIKDSNPDIDPIHGPSPKYTL